MTRIYITYTGAYIENTRTVHSTITYFFKRDSNLP